MNPESREEATRILLIDDDVEFCDLLGEDLQLEHFHVDAVHDGVAGVNRIRAEDYDLVLLDVMLPGMSGLEVLRKVRTESTVPVLMLSAKGEDVDRIVGLEMGADDYLAKPFNSRELLARIRAILRRAELLSGESAKPGTRLEVGDLSLCPGTRSVKREAEAVDLTSAEFDLLELLLRRAGTVVSREEISEEVLGREFSPIDRSVDIHVSRLRKKLGPTPSGDERIKTIRGAGYMYRSE